MSKSLESTPLGLRRAASRTGSEEGMEPPDPFTLYMTGKRLSDWRTMLPSPAGASLLATATL